MRGEIRRAAEDARHHRDLRDARPGGGAGDLRPHRRDARRARRADRRAGRDLPPARDAVRRGSFIGTTNLLRRHGRRATGAGAPSSRLGTSAFVVPKLARAEGAAVTFSLAARGAPPACRRRSRRPDGLATIAAELARLEFLGALTRIEARLGNGMLLRAAFLDMPLDRMAAGDAMHRSPTTRSASPFSGLPPHEPALPPRACGFRSTVAVVALAFLACSSSTRCRGLQRELSRSERRPPDAPQLCQDPRQRLLPGQRHQQPRHRRRRDAGYDRARRAARVRARAAAGRRQVGPALRSSSCRSCCRASSRPMRSCSARARRYRRAVAARSRMPFDLDLRRRRHRRGLRAHALSLRSAADACRPQGDRRFGRGGEPEPRRVALARLSGP